MSCRLTVESSMTHHETSIVRLPNDAPVAVVWHHARFRHRSRIGGLKQWKDPSKFRQSHHFKVHQLDEKTKHGTAKHAQHCIMMLGFIIFVLAEHHMNLFPVASKSLSAQPPPSHDVEHLPLSCRRVEACLAAWNKASSVRTATINQHLFMICRVCWPFLPRWQWWQQLPDRSNLLAFSDVYQVPTVRWSFTKVGKNISVLQRGKGDPSHQPFVLWAVALS